MIEIKVVVKKYKPHNKTVIEGVVTKRTIHEGVIVCKQLDEMATLAADIDSKNKAVHYLGEKGVKDNCLDN